LGNIFVTKIHYQMINLFLILLVEFRLRILLKSNKALASVTITPRTGPLKPPA